LSHAAPTVIASAAKQSITRVTNIEEFTSSIESAAFTGEDMFRAVLKLGLAEHVSSEEVRRVLERLADEIMVDLRTGAEV